MSSGRKRTTDRHYSAEDQALDQISKEAEEKIQARRLARAEAREIRLREIERQQKEEEEKQKGFSKAPDLTSLSGYSGSRRGSDDSTGSDVSSSSRDPKDQVRVVKNKLRDLEEKYKAAMVTNAQLDNIKTSHVFQLELLKEQLEEQEENMIEVQRQYKDKSRDYDLLKRDFDALKLETEVLRQQIDMKDKLIKESGLVIATTDDGNLSLSRCSDLFDVPVTEMGSAIISEESADLLKKAGEGTLGKTDLSSKNDTCNDNNDQDSVIANPKTDVDNVVDTKVDGVNTTAENDVNISSNVSKISDNIVETHVDNNDDINTVDKGDGVDGNDINNTDTDYVCNNAAERVNNNEVVDSVGSSFNGNENKVDVESVAEGSERECKGDDSDDESDENDVFYESKAELSPIEVENDNSLSVESQGCEELPEKKMSESDTILSGTNVDFPPDKTSDNDEKSVVDEGSVIDVNDNVSKGSISENDNDDRQCGVGLTKSESEKTDNIANEEHDDLDVLECDKPNNDDKYKCPDLVFNLDESDSIEVEPNVNATVVFPDFVNMLSSRPVLTSESFISLESDVTYHSESDDEDMNTGLESVSEDTGIEIGKADQVKDVVNDQTDSVFDDCFLHKSSSAIPLCSSVSSQSDTGDNTLVSTEEISEDVWKEINKASDDKAHDNHVCRSFSGGLHSDDVFMSTPLEDIRADISIDRFAREYVKDVIQTSVDLYNSYVGQDKISVRKQSASGENIDISVSKSHYSEELLESASSVFTERLPSGNVEILSPFQGVSTNNDDQKFFSCKVETDIGGVKNDNLSEERKQSLISGFAVCYTGGKGLSDVESDSDENDETEPVVNVESPDICQDFCIMPMNISNKTNVGDSTSFVVETDKPVKHEPEEEGKPDDVSSAITSVSQPIVEENIGDESKDCSTETNDEHMVGEELEGVDKDVNQESTNPPSSNVSDDVPVSEHVVDSGTSDIKVESTDDVRSENDNLEIVKPEKNVDLEEDVSQNVTEKSLPEIDAAKTGESDIDSNNLAEETGNNAVNDKGMNIVDETKLDNGNTDLVSKESDQAVEAKNIESDDVENTKENCNDFNESNDENENSSKELDNRDVEVSANENLEDSIQGAHGGESEDEDDEHSGISLSDDDILADLEKCEESDVSHITEVTDMSEDKNENKIESVKEDKQAIAADLKNEDIWVKKGNAATDDKGKGRPKKDSVTSEKSGNRKSDEVPAGDEDDLESVLNRKQSKKKSKKKNSKEKEECLLS